MRLRLLLLLLCFLLLLAGCASVSVAPVESAQEQAAQALLLEGKSREAALAYQDIAATTRSPVRDRAWVRAANAWERVGDTTAARAALALANRGKLIGGDAFLHDLLSAQFMLADGRGREARGLLNQNRESVPASERTRWHSLRARVFEISDLPFELAGEYAWLAVGLSPKESAANGRNTQRLLGLLDNHTLAQKSALLAANDPLYPFAARELSKRGLPLPHLYERGASPLTKNFPPADADGYRPPEKLAVLLPMSGSLAVAAAGVRDGILAAYYAENRRRPTITFYNSAGTAAGAQKAATQALADGAQMLLGPLTRDEVNGVFKNNDTGVAILALNRGQNPPPPGSASFALLPDEEGFAIADHLADQGLLKVLVLTQRDDNAQRALAVFREQLQLRGGEVVGEAIVNDDASSFVTQLPALLTSAKTPPTAIFLTLKAAPARMVAAQLKLSALASLPRIASSLILNGSNARLDTELDGIQYPELPWLIDSYAHLPDADVLAKNLPSARGPAQRLFAFGNDAYKLAAYLDHFNNDPGFSLRGATGELRLDNFGFIQREPGWAIFSGGRAQRAPDNTRVSHAALPQ